MSSYVPTALFNVGTLYIILMKYLPNFVWYADINDGGQRKIENSIQVKCTYTYKNKTATSIQVRKLFKGGN